MLRVMYMMRICILATLLLYFVVCSQSFVLRRFGSLKPSHRPTSTLLATFSRAPPIGKIKLEAVIDKAISIIPLEHKQLLMNQTAILPLWINGTTFDPGHVISYGTFTRFDHKNKSILHTEVQIYTDIVMFRFDDPYFRLIKNRASTEFRDLAIKLYSELSLDSHPEDKEVEFLTHKLEFRVLVWAEKRTKLFKIRVRQYECKHDADMARHQFSEGKYPFRRFRSIKRLMTSFRTPPACACEICGIKVKR